MAILRRKTVPFQSFRRIIQTIFLLLLMIACLTILKIHWTCQICIPEFEHPLQREFMQQINRSQTFARIEHRTQGSKTFFTTIYEKQLIRYRSAIFLPTFQNDRLQFNFNRITNFRLSNTTRDLLINCITSDGQRINFTIQQNISAWTLKQFDSKQIIISSSNVNNLRLNVRQKFSRQTTFNFTYQWSNSTVSHSFTWPIWPIQKSCLDLLSPRGNFSCLFTNILRHSSSRELFFAERSAVQHWLNIQYEATHSNSLSFKQTKTRRLAPFEIASNETICPIAFTSWIEKYHIWHENILHRMSKVEKYEDFILDNDLRFLLYQTMGSGTADRIVHLITTYLIAILTKRVFLFDLHWSDFSETIQSALNDSPPRILSWFSSSKTLHQFGRMNSPKRITFQTHSFSANRLTNDFDYEKRFTQRVVTVRAHTGGLAPMISSNTSRYRKFLTEELHLTIDNIFGCLYHSFLIHRLSALVDRTSQNLQHSFGHSSQQLLQILLSPEYFPIGVQVRMGDDFLKDEVRSRPTSDALILKPFINYIGCARQWSRHHQKLFIETEQIPLAFLMSDLVRLRHAVLRRWQYPSSCFHSLSPACPNSTSELHFLASPNRILHLAYTKQRALAFNLAMFDIFLFGLCEQHLITHDSGFGRIGVFAALKHRKIFSLSPKEYLYCSNNNDTIPLSVSSYDWSGV